jgi:hypothetical protein
MNYNISTIPLFDRQAKRLAKRYPSFKSDLIGLLRNLKADPTQGIPLGNNFYKIRLAISSKGRGKSGGARVITFLKLTQSTIYLTAIYDKSIKSSITESELNKIFKLIP